MILSLAFAFLQGTILPVVFIEGLLVVFYLVTRSVRLGPPLILSGLVFDLVQNQKLGLTSLIFLAALALVLILKNNVILRQTVVLSCLAVAINALREILLFGHIEIFPLVLLFGICYLVFRTFWRPDVSGKIRI